MSENLADRIIRFFSESEFPTLFAGAGVSLRAGIPTWGDFLRELAEQARRFDILTRHKMIEEIDDGELLSAASYYYLCRKIPNAEKYSIIRNLLDNYDANKITPLLCLPFKSIITTNYDKALYDAYAITKGSAAIEHALGDAAFKSALYEEKYFIARIHGRAEYPESIILNNDHYARLAEDRNYKE